MWVNVTRKSRSFGTCGSGDEFKSTIDIYNKLSVVDYGQLKAYLKSIDKLDDFELIFDKKYLKHKLNLSNDTEILKHAKSEMKNVFVDKAEDLFEVIWANQNLRTSLFGDIINNAPDIQTAKALSQTNFTQLINTEADKLFKFIKVE